MNSHGRPKGEHRSTKHEGASVRSRALHIALVWIMTMALPVQAVAATVMLLCAQQPAAQVQSAHLHGAPAASHDATGHASPAHHHAGQPASDLGADTQHQCSACANCGAGAAFPTATVRVAADEPEREAAAPLTLREPSVVLSGLERPPRSRG